MTSIIKGRDGWKAEDTVQFEPEGYHLKVVTMKGSRGMNTTVTRVKIVPAEPRVYSFEMFGDYCKTHALDPKARCTEKSVAVMHAGVMADIDSVKAKVRDFYAAKETA